MWIFLKPRKNDSDNLNNIYKKVNNILIDINDNFSFNKDSRNKIHLLLFFTNYNNKLDIKPCCMPVIKTAISKKIPIIIVINKADKLFQTQNNEDSDDSDNLMETFKIQIEATNNKLYETLKKELNINEIEEIEYVCIDCILKYGLDDLLETIYNKFKNKLISDIDLDKIHLNKIQKENLSILVGNSIFLGNGSLDEIILDEAIYKSSIDIKELIIKYFGFYENKLKLGTKIYFFLKEIFIKFGIKQRKDVVSFLF